MSDSEDEFQSADEGETEDSPEKVTSSQPSGESSQVDVKECPADSTSTTTTESINTDIQPVADSSAEELQKDSTDVKGQSASADTKEKSNAKGKQKGSKRKGKSQMAGKSAVKSQEENKSTEGPQQETEATEAPDQGAKASDETLEETAKHSSEEPAESAAIAADQSEHISSETNQSDVDITNSDQSTVSSVDSRAQETSQEASNELREDSQQSDNAASDIVQSNIEKDSAVPNSRPEETSRDKAEPVSSAEPEDTSVEKTESIREKEVSSLFDKLSADSDAKPDQPIRDSHEQSVLERLSRAGEQKQQSSGWGSWGSWGSSLLNTATSSINTFTGQVSEGMHTVVETFEASVGAPPPSELAKDISQHVKEPDVAEKVIPKDSTKSDNPADTESAPDKEDTSTSVAAEQSAGEPVAANKKPAEESSDWFASWGVSDITNQLSSKTMGLMESGVNVLETIGKKTMEQIKETDPGFVKTKGLLRGNSTSLSQVIREAKEENERKAAEESSAEPLVSYSMLFDQHQGLACLEALELLSITATKSVGSADGLSDDTQQTIDSLTDKFTSVYDSDDECEEDHDFSAGMDDFVSKLMLPVKHSRTVSVQSKAREWLTECQKRQDSGERVEGREIHKEAINSFAELTSSTIELCHKSAALLSLSSQEGSDVDVETVSNSFISILKLVSNEISLQSQKYNDCLNTAADDSEYPDSINPMITDVFLEASNSTSYVKDAFKLLLPILQRCVISIEK